LTMDLRRAAKPSTTFLYSAALFTVTCQLPRVLAAVVVLSIKSVIRHLSNSHRGFRVCNLGSKVG
jgi:hypothetical protein